MSSRKIFVLAGEISGDIHAAAIVQAIRAQEADAQFFSTGGPQLKAATTQLVDTCAHAVMGLVEVVTSLPKQLALFDEIKRHIETVNPDVVIFVDCPEFNLRMAKAVKKHGRKLVYFISPKLWVWREGRVKIVKECIDEMLVIFPFEVGFYAKHGVKAQYVGHPLVTKAQPHQSARAAYHADIDHEPHVLLLPGSRRKEIKMCLAMMLDAADKVRETVPRVRFTLIKHPTLPAEMFADVAAHGVELVETYDPYPIFAKTDAAMACSGTVTYELAILWVPTVVMYTAHHLTYLLWQALAKIKWASMLNIILGKTVFPELLQYDATSDNLAKETISLLGDEARRRSLFADLEYFHTIIAPFDADKAARCVLTK